jgi:hypothetical protein
VSSTSSSSHINRRPFEPLTVRSDPPGAAMIPPSTLFRLPRSGIVFNTSFYFRTSSMQLARCIQRDARYLERKVVHQSTQGRNASFETLAGRKFDSIPIHNLTTVVSVTFERIQETRRHITPHDIMPI